MYVTQKWSTRRTPVTNNRKQCSEACGRDEEVVRYVLEQRTGNSQRGKNMVSFGADPKSKVGELHNPSFPAFRSTHRFVEEKVLKTVQHYFLSVEM